ncbi:hypothetical protein [Bacillus cereus]
MAIAQKERSVIKEYLEENESFFDSAVVRVLKKMEDKYNELFKNFMRDGTASVL